MRTALFLVAALCISAVPLAAEEENRERDTIVVDGQPEGAFVEAERLDGVHYKPYSGMGGTKRYRWSEVDRIDYAGMDGGYYRAGMDEKEGGNYNVAAERFMTLARGAEREWQAVYGYFEAGESYELAGNYDEAANAFAQLCAGYPEHVRWMDAKYREGINLAREEKTDAAKAAADALMAYGDANRAQVSRGPEYRANAIKAALAAEAGDMNEAQSLVGRVIFTARDGDTWYHWNNFWAGFLLEQEEYRDAAAAYEQMLHDLSEDPGRLAEVSLNYGIALAKDGREDAALLQFLQLDVLPYGSASQRCKAQYWAGRLLLEQSKAAAAEEEGKKRQGFARSMEAQAKVLLEAAAGSISSAEEKTRARQLYDLTWPPEEVPEEGAEADGAKTAEAQ